MKVQSINANYCLQDSAQKTNNVNFKTNLKLTFPTSNIPCDYNHGKSNFSRVIGMFRTWLSSQTPKNSTLTISQKGGNLVDQRKVRGAGGVSIEQCYENLEFSMDGASCGFCWNDHESENTILEDFKKTFNYVKSQAGY